MAVPVVNPQFPGRCRRCHVDDQCIVRTLLAFLLPVARFYLNPLGLFSYLKAIEKRTDFNAAVLINALITPSGAKCFLFLALFAYSFREIQASA